MSDERPSLTYRQAGVDIDAGNRLVELIGPAVARTRRPEVLAGLGGFGGLFALPPGRWREPVLVSGTDGVGTKLKLAQALGRHDTIGIDLVAMCVNDIAVTGAEPLFFLDYFATGRLDPAVAAEVVGGIARGCEEAGCALIGGETAEMPDMYEPGSYDLAGFAVGVVERDQLLDGSRVEAGNQLVGWASSGVHSNGFSLVRRILERSAAELSGPFAGELSLGDVLLAPTRLYVRPILACLATGQVRAFAHITGGGLLENVIRVIPDHLAIELDPHAWPQPAIFAWLASAGGVAEEEMLRTFNCGIGLVSVAPAEAFSTLAAIAADHGIACWPIGIVLPAAEGPRVRLR